jgi:hypothetical protein
VVETQTSGSSDTGTETGAPRETGDDDTTDSQPAIVQEPDLPPTPELTAADAGTETGVDSTGTESGESGADDTADDTDDGGKEKPKDRTPASVEFHTSTAQGGFGYVYVRVNKQQELTLQPLKSIQLRPGTHRVEIRETEDGPWKKAGNIKIDPGKSYRARMLNPPGIKLEEL